MAVPQPPPPAAGAVLTPPTPPGSPGRSSRGWLVWLLLLGGAALIAVAFKMQADVNAKNAVSSLLGTSAAPSPGPWVVGVIGAAAVLLGLLAARR